MAAGTIEVVINGRFLSRRPTGVDRVAEELLRAINDLVGESEPLRAAFRFEIVTPTGAEPRFDLPHIRQHTFGSLKGQLWEQLDLPRAVGRRFLVNPCNVGPLAVRNALTIIHDAQIYQTPQAYSRVFRSWYRFLLPLLARRSARVVTVSQYSRAELERYRVAPPGKIEVVPNGGDHILRVEPDPGCLDRLGLASNGYFLVIGSLSPHKNLGLLHAVDRLPRSIDMPIVVAGGMNASVFADGGDAATARSGNVRYVGRVSDGELRTLYRNARALLFPSLFEGFGLPPLEAMRSGCPVIASSIPAVVETCADAVLYADPSDPQAWARRIDEVAADDGLRSRLAEAGIRRAARFSWRSSAISLLGLIGAAHGRRVSPDMVVGDGRPRAAGACPGGTSVLAGSVPG